MIAALNWFPVSIGAAVFLLGPIFALGAQGWMERNR